MIMRSKNDKKDIGKRIRKYRFDHELSLQKLSLITRISPSALWYIENGFRDPEEMTVHKILKAIPDLLEDLKGSAA